MSVLTNSTEAEESTLGLFSENQRGGEWERQALSLKFYSRKSKILEVVVQGWSEIFSRKVGVWGDGMWGPGARKAPPLGREQVGNRVNKGPEKGKCTFNVEKRVRVQGTFFFFPPHLAQSRTRNPAI